MKYLNEIYCIISQCVRISCELNYIYCAIIKSGPVDRHRHSFAGSVRRLIGRRVHDYGRLITVANVVR